MKRQLALLGLGIAATLGTNAFAGQVTQTLTVPTTALDFTSTLSFNKFDPTLGTLVDIQFISNVSANDTTTITNTSGRSRTFTFNSSVDLQITDAASMLVFDEALPFTSQMITLANGATTTASGTSSGGATAVYSAPSGALSSYSGSAATGNPSNPIVIANFIGAGNISLLFDASNNSTVIGGSNNSSSSGTASGSLQVIYDYSVPTNGTPEPTTMVLFGTALVGLGTLRKFRKKSL